MTGLGVSISYSRTRNLEIIADRFERNPSLTRMQTNYLARFAWVGHRKGKSYPDCKCLRCEGIELIDRQLVDEVEG